MIMPFWVCKICGSKNPSTNEDTKPQTNADRIRAMSDEELAEFVSNCGCPDHARNCIASCTDCTLKWLKQPVDMRGEEE